MDFGSVPRSDPIRRNESTRKPIGYSLLAIGGICAGTRPGLLIARILEASSRQPTLSEDGAVAFSLRKTQNTRCFPDVYWSPELAARGAAASACADPWDHDEFSYLLMADTFA